MSKIKAFKEYRSGESGLSLVIMDLMIILSQKVCLLTLNKWIKNPLTTLFKNNS